MAATRRGESFAQNRAVRRAYEESRSNFSLWNLRNLFALTFHSYRTRDQASRPFTEIAECKGRYGL